MVWAQDLDWGNLLAGDGGHDADNSMGIAPPPEGGVVILPLPSTSVSLVKDPKSTRLGGDGALAYFSS